MTTETVRTHVVLPKELYEELDRGAGPRRRSEFIVEAGRNQLRLRRRADIAHEFAGSLAGSGKHIPEWDTPESTQRWLQEVRSDRHDPWHDAGEAIRS